MRRTASLPSTVRAPWHPPQGPRPAVSRSGWVLKAERRARTPSAVVFFLVYLGAVTVIGKGPTYLGYPPLFWGEMVLVVLAGWMLFEWSVRAFILPNPRPLSVAVSLYVVLGIALTAISIPRWGLDAVRDAAIWYYAAFYFFGLRLARAPLGDTVWKTVRVFWVLAMFWGAADHLSQHRLSEMGPLLPWRGVSVLWNSHSELYQNMALGAILVLGTDFLRRFPLLRLVLSLAALPALLFFAQARGRGGKVGLVVGILVISTLIFAPGRPLRISARVLSAIAAIALLLVVGSLLLQTDIATLTNFNRFARDEGTSAWRWTWWQELAKAVMSTNPAFGLGFGQDWQVYQPAIVRDAFDPWPVRAPHNFNVTVFSRMGIVGAGLWAGILALGLGGLFVRLWRGRVGPVSYHPTRREELAFWLLMLLTTWGNSTFGVLMEGPALGIWFWFALGFASARSLATGHK